MEKLENIEPAAQSPYEDNIDELVYIEELDFFIQQQIAKNDLSNLKLSKWRFTSNDYKEQLTEFITSFNALFLTLVRQIDDDMITKKCEQKGLVTPDETEKEEVSKEVLEEILKQKLMNVFKENYNDFISAIEKQISKQISKQKSEFEKNLSEQKKKIEKEKPAYSKIELDMSEFKQQQILKNQEEFYNELNTWFLGRTPAQIIEDMQIIFPEYYEQLYKEIVDQCNEVTSDLLIKSLHVLTSSEVQQIQQQVEKNFKTELQQFIRNQGQHSNIKQLKEILNFFLYFNLPCKRERYEVIEEMINNVIAYQDQDSQNILREAFEEAQKSHQNLTIQQLREQKGEYKDRVQALQLSEDEALQNIIYFYFTSSNCLDKRASVKLNNIGAQKRDLLKNLIRKLVLSQRVEIVLSKIEELINNFQKQQCELNLDSESKQLVTPFYEQPPNISDVAQFLQYTMENEKQFMKDAERTLTILYNKDTKMIEQQLSIMRNAFKTLNELSKECKGKFPRLCLANIANHELNAKHIHLVVSGFLSEGYQADQDWRDLNQYFQDRNIHCYDVQWESTKQNHFIAHIMKYLVKAALMQLIEVFIGGRKIKLALRVLKMYIQSGKIKNVFKEASGLFKDARKRGRITGKMLACALALKYPFKDHTVSFSGYSLGTEIVTSCVKELYRLGAHDIVQNVTLLGGATTLKDKGKKNEWTAILSSVVNGNFKNVYTKKDIVLVLFNLSEYFWNLAIGRRRIFKDQVENLENDLLLEENVVSDKQLFRCKNHDIGKLITLKNDFDTVGHFFYRKRLADILHNIEFDS